MLRFNVQLTSRLNQLSLSHESNRKVKKKENKQKTDELLSPEMVIESVRSVREGEGDYGGKDLSQR